MKKTTLREKIGQMFVCGFPGTSMNGEFIELVKKYKVGNVILFKHNIESLAQMKTLCADIQKLIQSETGFPAFITIDQEGGAVSRLAEDELNVPGAMALAATGDEKNAYTAGLLTAEILRGCGVNFDLAPVLDVNSNPNNPVIGVRSYGDNPDIVARFGIQMIRGLAEGGVLSSAKHFPGHGDTSVDSHLTLPTVRKTRAELDKVELMPFAKAVRSPLSAVTISHIVFPAIDKDVPATMSKKIVTDLLKKELGFSGLVISDCMEMKAVQKFFGTPQSCVGAINAGIELIFISHTVSTARDSLDEVFKECENGRIKAEVIDGALSKIIALKEKLPRADSLSGKPLSGERLNEIKKAIADLRKKTITAYPSAAVRFPDFGENPFFAGPQPFIITNVSNDVDTSISFASHMQKEFGGTAADTSIDPDDAEIAKIRAQAENASAIAAATYNGHVKRGQLKLVRALAELGKPLLVAALRNPYDLGCLSENLLQRGVCGIAAYEYSNSVLSCITDILKRGENCEGRLGLTIPAIDMTE